MLDNCGGTMTTECSIKTGRASMLLALVTVSVVGATSALAAPPSEDYELIFSDEFNGDRVDESTWDYRIGRRGGEDPAAGWINAMALQKNVSVGGGFMRILHAQETLDGKTENTCGGLISKRRFGFGYYESRFKPLMLTSTGTHAAFWQRGLNAPLDTPSTSDPTRPQRNTIFEIDSSEISSPGWMGTNNLYVQIDAQGPVDSWAHRCSVPIKPDAEGFVVDAFEYRPDGVIFYDNGKEVARTPFNKLTAQQEVWLTSLCGAGWRSMDASQLPGEALFDYFRYYAKDWPGANLLGGSGFEYNRGKADPEWPVGWLESGDMKASFVTKENPTTGEFLLRHSADTAYRVVTSQTLQHIRDGVYTASAMVRSSGGQKVATFSIESGGKTVAVDVPQASQWTRVEIPQVSVTGHTATVAITSDAGAGQWLEVDDVVFMKPPLQGQTVPQPEPWYREGDPRYAIFDGLMQSFADKRHYLFDRSTGRGKAISVALRLKHDRLVDQGPIEKFPQKGNDGWSVQLTKAGDLAFVIGSQASNTRVVATNAYAAGKPVDVACVFDDGVATIYIDGKVVASQAGITQRTDDKTAPGCMGVYWSREVQAERFSGELGNVRVYNRALSADEVKSLHTAGK
jgi:hypothetical protein